MVDTFGPAYMSTLSIAQLRVLAYSTDPAHVVAGFAAHCELIKRSHCGR